MVGFDWTKTVVLALALSACGPAVDVDDADGGDPSAEGSDTGGTDSDPGTMSSASSVSSSTSPDDDATGSAHLDLGGSTGLPDLSGDHLFAVAAVIDPAHPLQFLATITQENVGGDAQLTISLQPLALDPQATTTPRTPVGEPTVVQAGFGQDRHFGIELPQIRIPGAANPITGSDIVTSMVIEGDVMSGDLWCGIAFGTVTEPLMLDLQGSTFAGTRVAGGQLPGDPIPAACPP